MRGALLTLVAAMAMIIGGTAGGLIAWRLNDLHPGMDPEGFWFISVLAGAGCGLTTTFVTSLCRLKGRGWKFVLLVGRGAGAAVAAGIVSFV